MSEENETPVVTPRRRKVNPDLVRVESIRNGGWREVLGEVGSEEYNRLRLLALK